MRLITESLTRLLAVGQERWQGLDEIYKIPNDNFDRSTDEDEEQVQDFLSGDPHWSILGAALYIIKYDDTNSYYERGVNWSHMFDMYDRTRWHNETYTSSDYELWIMAPKLKIDRPSLGNYIMPEPEFYENVTYLHTFLSNSYERQFTKRILRLLIQRTEFSESEVDFARSYLCEKELQRTPLGVLVAHMLDISVDPIEIHSIGESLMGKRRFNELWYGALTKRDDMVRKWTI